jgi:MSHA biogenesis protein MshO
MYPFSHSPSAQRGFTLIELVMVIVIMGVIGGVVAVFMRAPINAYFDSGRRAALTDVADTAVRRISRDIRKALPNSIRNTNSQCIEFIPTKTGGRYRATDATVGDGTGLDFTAADTRFNMLGKNSLLPTDQQIQPNDIIAVYNLGITGASAYLGNNTTTVNSVTDGAETVIGIASKLFPFESGSKRFHVIPGAERVVAYVCAGDGTLRRTVATTSFASACPSNGDILATNVSACTFVYNGSDLQRNALVQMSISITSSNETVSLYHEVHVNNTP